MEQQIQTYFTDEFFMSAVQHEIFNRIFPTIRHDIVGNVSGSLIRMSIIDRILKKDVFEPEKVKSELVKIDQQLRNSILEIRELIFWDFATSHQDFPVNILIKSVQLISTQLTFKGIQLNVQPTEYELFKKVETKPLLYTLLCIFSFLEDNDFENSVFTITLSANLIRISQEYRPDVSSNRVTINRNLKISKEITLQFAKLHLYNLLFLDQEILLEW